MAIIRSHTSERPIYRVFLIESPNRSNVQGNTEDAGITGMQWGCLDAITSGGPNAEQHREARSPEFIDYHPRGRPGQCILDRSGLLELKV